MSHAPDTGEQIVRDAWGNLPDGLADLLRPEMAGLAEEIVAEIVSSLPEWSAALGRREDQFGWDRAERQSRQRDRLPLHQAVAEALAAFVRHVEDPADRQPEWARTCRLYGRDEARAGRSLDLLQACCRSGLQVAWRRMMRVGTANALPPEVMSDLAEAVFAFVDEIVSLALQGHASYVPASAGEPEENRARLLRLIMERPAVPRSTIMECAALGRWTVPDEVTPVAIQPGSRVVREALHSDLLHDLRADQPHLLIPGPFTAGRREMLGAALLGHRAAIGVSVPCTAAADSLRWARRVLALANAGVIEDSSLTFCDDHLLTLWLMSDPMLLEQLGRRSLAALDGLTRWQRHRITETLGAWLEARGNAVEVAERLHVHPQTVRYRMRQIRQIFGDQIDDPSVRFELELGVRAVRLRESRSSRTIPPPRREPR
jgi:hypothetical protein